MPELSMLVVSTYPPRHDGLATFAADLVRGIASQTGVRVRIIAIEPEGETFPYSASVVGRIQQNDRASYLRAAQMVHRLHPDVVSLQHEYGLWGVWGDGLEEDFAVPFLEAVTTGPHARPVVTTLHTIRPTPDPLEREVLATIVRRSAASVVMARSGALLLADDYDVPLGTVVRIPHGVPVVEHRPRRSFKRRLGLEGRIIISTLGLLDPRKGIEYAIAAMRHVVEQHPSALYLVAGETHPQYRKHHGEQYRNELHALVRELKLTEHVRFVNHYLGDRELVDYLQATDIYLTPYLDRNQITSGTLAFAVGTGKAIVSTPYVHAVEVLSEGRGLLAEFRDSASIGHCLQLLLDDPERRRELEARMAAYGKEDSWPVVGEWYTDLFDRVVTHDPLTDFLAVQPDPLAVGLERYRDAEQ